MRLNFTGNLTAKSGLTSGTSKAGKEWKKMTFVVEVTDEGKAATIAFDTLNERVIADLQNVPVGAWVDVDCYIDSREYNGRWYTSLNAYAVAAMMPTKQVAPQQANPNPNPNTQAFFEALNPTNKEELPF